MSKIGTICFKHLKSKGSVPTYVLTTESQNININLIISNIIGTLNNASVTIENPSSFSGFPANSVLTMTVNGAIGCDTCISACSCSTSSYMVIGSFTNSVNNSVPVNLPKFNITNETETGFTVSFTFVVNTDSFTFNWFRMPYKSC